MHKVVGTVRPPFLLLTPACLLLALAVADSCCTPVKLSFFFVALTGALTAHISVNAFNEYFDFRSELDMHTQRTPFSGGSGTLIETPKLAPLTFQLAVLSLLLTCICGGFFIWIWGATILLPIGLTGVLLITLYTSVIVRYPLLCLIASGAGFGLIMVVGSVFAMTGQLFPGAFWASLPVFFVTNNLLLLNQIPDMAADRRAGRRTLPVVAGLKRSAQVYLLIAGLGMLSLIIGIALGALPGAAALALLPLICAAPITTGVLRSAANTEKLLPYLAANITVSLATPVLLAIGIWLG